MRERKRSIAFFSKYHMSRGMGIAGWEWDKPEGDEEMKLKIEGRRYKSGQKNETNNQRSSWLLTRKGNKVKCPVVPIPLRPIRDFPLLFTHSFLFIVYIPSARIHEFRLNTDVKKKRLNKNQRGEGNILKVIVRRRVIIQWLRLSNPWGVADGRVPRH